MDTQTISLEDRLDDLQKRIASSITRLQMQIERFTDFLNSEQSPNEADKASNKDAPKS